MKNNKETDMNPTPNPSPSGRGVKSQSHIGSRREKLTRLKAYICQCLKWTELEYCTYQYEQGLRYLELAVPSGAVRLFEEDKVFWTWWRNQGMMRDEVFESSMFNDRVSLNYKRLVYVGIHDGEKLVDNLQINGCVLDVCRRQMETDIELIENEGR